MKPEYITLVSVVGVFLLAFGIEPFVEWKNRNPQPILSSYFRLLKWFGLRRIQYREGIWRGHVRGFVVEFKGYRYVWVWSKEWRNSK